MKRFGNNARLWVELANGTFVQVDGNQTLSRGFTAQNIDMTTKADGGWGSEAPGTRSWRVSGGFLPDLPDAGFERLVEVSIAETPTPVNIQIRDGGDAGADPADVVLAGSVYVGEISDDMNQNSPWTHAMTLTGNGAPTTWTA